MEIFRTAYGPTIPIAGIYERTVLQFNRRKNENPARLILAGFFNFSLTKQLDKANI